MIVLSIRSDPTMLSNGAGALTPVHNMVAKRNSNDASTMCIVLQNGKLEQCLRRFNNFSGIGQGQCILNGFGETVDLPNAGSFHPSQNALRAVFLINLLTGP